MAWHPHANRLAVAHKDNCIYLYERVFGVSHWTCSVLKHKLMRKMTCIEWKPRSGGVLAVGCSYGVCVWDLYGKRGKDVPLESQGHLHPTACMSYFHSPGYTHISSVAWDPSLGSHCLVAASMATSSLVVYDTITHASTLLRRRGKGNRLLRWSPNGKRLYASNMSGKSHMWDTETWACIKVSHSPGLWVETACWSPDSRTLYYSMLGKRDLHVLHQSFAENSKKEEQNNACRKVVQGVLT
ncbi:hypothetical protein BDF14DRAFT_1737648 [Spinellus fusiger]|nr:hypothetical protein BDF14DRAFT_1737648 [Spinellus fusiger]